MNEQNDKYLCEKYSKIFSGRNGDPKETLMCFGFCHDDGWFNIIDSMCSLIQSHIDRLPEGEREEKQFVAVQVKEKFGELRVYGVGGDQFTSGVIAMASEISRVTCEACGKPGKISGPGWYRCLCEDCRSKK